MLKRYISFVAVVLMAHLALCAQTESTLTLTISQAGSLRSLLSDKQFQETTSITLLGEIDVRDLRVLQEMSSSQGALQNINLAQAKIVAFQEVAPANTFDILPMPPIDFGATKSQVEEYEQKHNGILNEDMSGPEGLHQLLWFDVTDNVAQVHCYFISNDGEGILDEFWGFYPEAEKAVLVSETGYSLTDAFINLLTSSGFLPPQSLGEDGFVTTNQDLGIDLSINISPRREITGEESDENILVLMYAPAGEYM